MGWKTQSRRSKCYCGIIEETYKNKRNKSSIGIITFNTEQEYAIEDAIDKECQKDSAFRDAYIREQNRKKMAKTFQFS